MVTDRMVAGIVAERGVQTLRLDDAEGDWPDRRRQILAFLDLPPVDDTDTSWWPEPRLPPPTVWGTDADREPSATGQPVPELAAYDETMLGLLKRWQVPGAALAVALQGRLILARGYGRASLEENQLVQPDSLFRICSVSKPITAAAILKLVEQGSLELDRPAIGGLDHLLPPVWAGAEQFYGLGWMVRPMPDHTAWSHDGCLPGTMSLLVGNSRGTARAVLCNTRPDDWRIFQGEVEHALSRVGRTVSTWPARDLFDTYLA
jgi:hypothetical protein